VGQPELKALLAKPELRQLSQRITARFHLTPLTLSETQAYIRHRLKVAGLPEGRSPFPFAIIKRIHAFTGGIPRLINVICERCLMGAYAANKIRVDNDTFNAARKEVVGSQPQTSPRDFYWKVAAGIFGVALIGNALYFNAAYTKADSKAATTKVVASASTSQATTTSASSSSVPVLGFMVRNYKKAEDSLFSYLGIPLTSDARPCGKNPKTPLHCEKTSVHTWTELGEINRPAILILATPDKFSTYVVLLGLNEDTALVLDERQHKIKVPLATLGREWTGEIVYLWKKPASFSETIVPGDSSATVEWVANQFAKLDKQKDALTNDLFSLALEERIKIFQRNKGLTADGTINQATLMKLNEAAGIDKTLITDF
jgi:general secretion pathway protein A